MVAIVAVDPAENEPSQDRTSASKVPKSSDKHPRPVDRCLDVLIRVFMTPATAGEDRSPPRSENQGFRRNYFSFFSNPLTPNSSKFEISPKFCEAFFNPVKFRQIFIKICSKTREIDSKFAKNDEIWWKKLQK